MGRAEKNIFKRQLANDEFMSAALGDVNWLQQSLKPIRDSNTFDKNGLAPIHLAALHGRLDCLRLLVEKQKVDVNLPSLNGWRPLHLCISNQTGKRSLQCLIYLLEHDADPDVENEDGVTPVHQAASEGHVQCLKFLIELGAKIDGLDRRGHRAIDLAKLWSHKKCARILASEMWQKDKKEVAKEMGQLRKVKVQQLLRQIERQDQKSSEGNFYGKEAYDDWLNKEHKKQSLYGVKEPKKKKVKPKLRFSGDESDTLHKPNSNTADTGDKEITPVPNENKLPSRVKTPSKQDTKHSGEQNVEVITKLRKTGKPISQTSSSTTIDGSATPATLKSDTTNLGLYEISEELQKLSDTVYTDPESAAFYNTISWNYSTKVPKTEYVNILPDAYPRDNYSMMPVNDATPNELNIWHKPKIFVTDETERVKRADKEINKKRHMEDADNLMPIIQGNKTVVYKCKSVLDVETRRKAPDDKIPKNESGLHLSSDVNSKLFKSGLIIDLNTPSSSFVTSRSTSASSLPDDGVSAKQPFPRERIVQLLEHMSNRPSRFPDISGDEYDIGGNLPVY